MNLHKSTLTRRLNLIDSGLFIVLCLSGLGFFLARAGHAGVNQVIQGSSKIEIEVFIMGLKTKDTNLFTVGDRTFLTIRNQPVPPPMVISKVEHTPKQIAFLSPDGKHVLSFPDPTNAVSHDFLVTIKDEADRTADGYVIRGNKIKVGNQIDLEGFKYRVQGVVVDIRTSQ